MQGSPISSKDNVEKRFSRQIKEKHPHISILTPPKHLPGIIRKNDERFLKKILLLKVEEIGISVSSLAPSERFPVASPGDLGARKDYRAMGKVLVKGQLAGGLFMGGVGMGAVPLTLGVTIVTFHHLSVG